MGDRSGLVTVICDGHHSRLVQGLYNSFLNNRGVDFELRGDGGTVRAHRLVLDLFLSPEKLTQTADSDAPLDSLLEFLYNGRVVVPEGQLDGLLDVAKRSEFRLLVDALEVAVGDWNLTTGSDRQIRSPCPAQELPEGCSESGVRGGSLGESILPDIDRDDEPMQEEEEEEQPNDNLQEVDDTKSGVLPACSGLRVNKIKVECAGEQQQSSKENGVELDDEEEEQQEKPKKKNRCEVCGKSFASATYLRIHARFHTGETPYSCDICGRTFVSPNSYQGHLRTHANVRPFECQQCGKTFAQRGHLRTHVRSHSDEREFECEVCGKRYAYLQVLQRHQMKHSGDKPYGCPLATCAMTFPTNYHRNLHALTHTYPCGDCDKSFSKPESLLAHRALHADDDYGDCDTCGRPFKGAASLARHRLTHLSAAADTRVEDEGSPSSVTDCVDRDVPAC